MFRSRAGESDAVKRRKRKKARIKTLIGILVFLVLCAAGILYFFPELYGGTLSNSGPTNPLYSQSLVQSDSDKIPAFSGQDYVVLGDNRPCFNDYDLTYFSGEDYTPLDRLGRCGRAMALLDRSMMPTEERGEIGQIEPSGWVQAKYEGYVNSSPPYLYNRCHLIMYALTGQNANECNLITGTRYMNTETMLPFEIKVANYLEKTGNHVLYRVTPYFKGRELVTRGVEMEAYSVEDGGKGLSFHVFIYNYQPGIEIDYATGDSRIAE